MVKFITSKKRTGRLPLTCVHSEQLREGLVKSNTTLLTRQTSSLAEGQTIHQGGQNCRRNSAGAAASMCACANSHCYIQQSHMGNKKQQNHNIFYQQKVKKKFENTLLSENPSNECFFPVKSSWFFPQVNFYTVFELIRQREREKNARDS